MNLQEAKRYCPHCRRLFDGPKCPDCKSRRTPPRDPENGDLCFLTEQAQIWSEPLRDVLSQNGIPCEMEGRLGSGISTLVGYSQESYRFFVPYECLPTACDLVEQLFGGKYEPEQEEAQEESASEEEEE